MFEILMEHITKLPNSDSSLQEHQHFEMFVWQSYVSDTKHPFQERIVVQKCSLPTPVRLLPPAPVQPPLCRLGRRRLYTCPDCHAADHAVAHILSCPTHPTDLAWGEVWASPSW